LGENDHELDRRYQDQAWKLGITKQLSAAETKIDRLQVETERQTEKLDNLHNTVENALFGNALEDGLANKYRSLEDKLRLIWKISPWIILILIILGDRLSPLIFDWIYDKTHIRLFYSPVQEFKEEKSTTHVKHYHIYIKRSGDGMSAPGTDGQ
jgi:hypothetical protein